jgi:hypothetical protein
VTITNNNATTIALSVTLTAKYGDISVVRTFKLSPP